MQLLAKFTKEKKKSRSKSKTHKDYDADTTSFSELSGQANAQSPGKSDPSKQDGDSSVISHASHSSWGGDYPVASRLSDSPTHTSQRQSLVDDIPVDYHRPPTSPLPSILPGVRQASYHSRSRGSSVTSSMKSRTEPGFSPPGTTTHYPGSNVFSDVAYQTAIQTQQSLEESHSYQHSPSLRPSNARPVTMFYQTQHPLPLSVAINDDPSLEPPNRPFAPIKRARAGSMDNLQLTLSKSQNEKSTNGSLNSLGKLFSLPRGNRSSHELVRPKSIAGLKISSPVLIQPSHALSTLGPSLHDLVKDEEAKEAPTSPNLGLSTRSDSLSTNSALLGNDPVNNWFSKMHRQSSRPKTYHPGAIANLDGSQATGNETNTSPVVHHRKFSGKGERPKSTFVNLSARPPPSTDSSPFPSPDMDSLNREWDEELDLSNDMVLSSALLRTIEDTQGYKPLTLEYLETIKKDQSLLKTRINGLEARLEVEIKMRDAARSLYQLHSHSKKMSRQAKEQLDTANRKVCQVLEELRTLTTRSHRNEAQLVQHAAAVLRRGCVMAQNKSIGPRASVLPNRLRSASAQATIAPFSTQPKVDLDRSTTPSPVRSVDGAEVDLVQGQSQEPDSSEATFSPDMTLVLDRIREMERRLVDLQKEHTDTLEALDVAQTQLDEKEQLIVELRDDLDREMSGQHRSGDGSSSQLGDIGRSPTTYSTLSLSTAAFPHPLYRTPSVCIEALEQDMNGVSLPSWTQEPGERTFQLQNQVEQLQAEKEALLRRLNNREGDNSESESSLGKSDPNPTPSEGGSVEGGRWSRSSLLTDSAWSQSQGSSPEHPSETVQQLNHLKRSLSTITKAKEHTEANLKEEKFLNRKFKGSLNQVIDSLEGLFHQAGELYQWTYPASLTERTGTPADGVPGSDPVSRLKAVHRQLDFVIGAYGQRVQESEDQIEHILHLGRRLRSALSTEGLDLADDADDTDPLVNLTGYVEHLVVHCFEKTEQLRDLSAQARETTMDASIAEKIQAASQSYLDQITTLEERLSHQSQELVQLRETLDATETRASDNLARLTELTGIHKALQLRLRDKEDEVNQHKTQSVQLQELMVECQRTHLTPAKFDAERKKWQHEMETQLSQLRMAHHAQLHKVHGQYLAKDHQLNQRDEVLKQELEKLTQRFNSVSQRCAGFESERDRYEQKLEGLRHQVFALETALTQSKVDRIIGCSDSPTQTSFGDQVASPYLGKRAHSPSPLAPVGLTLPNLTGRIAEEIGEMTSGPVSDGQEISNNTLQGDIALVDKQEVSIKEDSSGEIVKSSAKDPQTSRPATPGSIHSSSASSRPISSTHASGGLMDPHKITKFYPQLLELRQEFRELVSDLRSQHHAQMDALAEENKKLTRDLRLLKQKYEERMWNAVNKALQTDDCATTVKVTPTDSITTV
ncbi:hypothetical protein IWQ61_000874 [Dispira simplex]|nr:hypothetical protein IWQ61_000874 [Dispira simplex]